MHLTVKSGAQPVVPLTLAITAFLLLFMLAIAAVTGTAYILSLLL